MINPIVRTKTQNTLEILDYILFTRWILIMKIFIVSDKNDRSGKYWTSWNLILWVYSEFVEENKVSSCSLRSSAYDIDIP